MRDRYLAIFGLLLLAVLAVMIALTVNGIDRTLVAVPIVAVVYFGWRFADDVRNGRL